MPFPKAGKLLVLQQSLTIKDLYKNIALAHQSVIITIGDELLIGQTIDTNSAWIAQKLNAEGINVLQRIAIGDETDAIKEALDDALTRAKIIFLTGGLGPTADDVTKPTLAAYFNSPLLTNEKVREHIKGLFQQRNRPILEGNLKQADVPENCTVLFNMMGTAPGMWFEWKDCVIIALPGVPFEMRSIMEQEVMPRLRKRFRDASIIHSTMVCLGLGESVIAERIKDIESSLPAHIRLAYLPAQGFVKLRLTGTGHENQDLREEIFAWRDRIQQRLGYFVAATEDVLPEEIVAQVLTEKGQSLGLAESCTGGCIANKITNIGGSSSFFKGSVVSYANEVKTNILKVPATILNTVGAVSQETVIQMAEEARKVLKTDIALSISGILGPTGATPEKPVGLVWMAITDGQKTISKKYQLMYDRLNNKEMAANIALNLIRLYTIGALE